MARSKGKGRAQRRYTPPSSGPGVLALPIAGIGLFALFAVEWLVGNIFASTQGGFHPSWLELAAIVPVMLIFIATEIVLAVTAHRCGYGALWTLFALPALLALIACAVWLAGDRSSSHGEPMWALTGILGGFNLILLLLAVRSLRRASRASRRRRPATRRR